MRRRFILGLGLWAVMRAASLAADGDARIRWRGPDQVGRIEVPQVAEASGLACSRRSPELYWTHNDSGGEPVLYAIDAAGRPRGSVRIDGVSNRDWEDVASFTLDGRAYLLAADVGDNSSSRSHCVLYVIAEPDPKSLAPGRELHATVAWEIPVRYPDGARDCESVAVDVTERAIYLISKRTRPPVVYRLPLVPPTSGSPTAVRVGELRGIPASAGLRGLYDRVRSLPCGLDITADGRSAAMVTYGTVYVYARTDGETWAAAFAREPIALAEHGLTQAEGICFTMDGRGLLVTSEGHHAPLVRYTFGNPP